MLRFTTSEQAAKNRIQHPCKVLHYYNAPLDFDEDKMKEVDLLIMMHCLMLRLCDLPQSQIE